jgi:hypothetical protein
MVEMLEGMKPEQKQTSCGVRKLYNTLDANDKKILFDALDDQMAWTNTDLEKALRDRGAKISYGVLRKHRKQECSCEVGWHNA